MIPGENTKNFVGKSENNLTECEVRHILRVENKKERLRKGKRVLA